MANEYGPGHYATTAEVADRPTPIATGKEGDRWFAQCDPQGNGGTKIDEMFLNALIAALRQATRTAGSVQAELSDVMLAEALCRAASGGVFFVDTGTANAHLLATPHSFVMPK